MEGYFLIHRQALDGWLWALPLPQFRVALTILAKANWKDGSTWSGGEQVKVARGQLMTSLPKLAEAAGVSIQTVRTSITNLKKADFLTDQSTDRYRLITVTNYERYQDPAGLPNRPSNSSLTAQQQPSNSPATAIETSKQVSRQSRKQNTFDFDAVYQSYPRKQGKAKGMSAIRKLVTTPEEYDALRKAVEKMAEGWRGQNTTYCPIWSTFINQRRWLDDDLPLPSVDPGKPAARPVPSFEPTLDELFERMKAKK